MSYATRTRLAVRRPRPAELPHAGEQPLEDTNVGDRDDADRGEQLVGSFFVDRVLADRRVQSPSTTASAGSKVSQQGVSGAKAGAVVRLWLGRSAARRWPVGVVTKMRLLSPR